MSNLNSSLANAIILSFNNGNGKTAEHNNNVYFTDETETVLMAYGKEYPVTPGSAGAQLIRSGLELSKGLSLEAVHDVFTAITSGAVNRLHYGQIQKGADKPAQPRPTVKTVISPLELAKQAIIADLQAYIELLSTGDELITSLTKDGYADITLNRVIDLSEARKANAMLLNKEHIDRATSLFNSLDDTTGILTPSPDESIMLGNSKTLTVFEPSIDIADGKLTITIYGASSTEASKLLASRVTANGFTCKVSGGKGSATISYTIAV